MSDANKQKEINDFKKQQREQFLKNAKPKDKGIGGHLRDTGLSLLSGAISVPETAVGLADIATGGQVGKTLENQGGMFGFRPKEAKEAIAGWKTEEGKEQLRKFQDTEGLGSKVGYALNNPSLITNTVAESLPAMGAGGVVGRGIGLAAKGLSPVAAGALGEGAVGAGLAAESIRQQTDDGLLTPKQTGLAAATGATTAGFGFAGGRLAKELGIADFDTSLVSGNLAGRTAAEIAEGAAKQPGIVKRAAGGALSEGLLEELPQSVSETILQNEALGRPLDEGVTDAAALGLLSGAAMGGFAGGMTRNRAPVRDDITPTEDMGQEAPRLGLPNPNKPSGGELVSQSQRYNQNPNNPNWIEDANPDYFNRGQGPNAANMRNLTPDPELPYNSELGGQFSAASDGTVFTESEYNDFLAAQQAQARAARDAGMSDINDVTQVPQGYEQAGNDPRLPAPDGTDFTAGADGQVYGRDDINTRLSQERDAAAERRARIARGEVLDRTPVPQAPKPSELMGLDPNKGSLSAAAAIAVDSGASPVASEFEQASAPAQSAWQSGMMDRLANADQNNSTYARLVQSMQNEPASVAEKTRLMREAESLPRAEVTAKQIKPNTRVLDEARAQTKAYTPEGKEVQAQWDVVDASDLITSNTDSFTINPNFPASRQPRDRTRASAQQQVNEIASKLQPNLLGESPDVSTGAPFVGASDNVVDSGNGRSMAIRRVYQEGGEKAGEYRQFVNEQAAKFGLDTDAVNMMQSPVLVRRNISDMNRDEFARAANKPTAARMSSTEQAASDSKNLPDASLLSFNGDGNMSLYQSQQYLKNFIAELPSTEQAAMMDDKGALSREGKNRIEAAIVQDAYNNPKLVSAISEKLDNDTTNVLRAITDKAPQISQINADMKSGDVYSNTLARDIGDATQAYMDIKNSEQDVDDYLSQDSLFDDGLTDGAKEILGVLSDNRRSAKAIGEYIQGRINEVTGRGNPKQGSMFDDFDTEAPNVLDNTTQAEQGGINEQDAPDNIQASTETQDSSRYGQPRQTQPTAIAATAKGDNRSQQSNQTTRADDESADVSRAPTREASMARQGAAGNDPQLKPLGDVAIGKNGKAKWFSSADKAKAFIDKKDIGATHEVVQDGKRFEILPKAQENQSAQEKTADAKLAEKHGFNEGNKLDHGELSIPDRTKNIDNDLDKYKADKAKQDKREREDKRFLANEREAARKPARERADELYKQHGKVLRARVKDKIYGTGNTPAEWLKNEARANPENFIKMAEQIISESEAETKPQLPVDKPETKAASPTKPKPESVEKTTEKSEAGSAGKGLLLRQDWGVNKIDANAKSDGVYVKPLFLAEAKEYLENTQKHLQRKGYKLREQDDLDITGPVVNERTTDSSGSVTLTMVKNGVLARMIIDDSNQHLRESSHKQNIGLLFQITPSETLNWDRSMNWVESSDSSEDLAKIVDWFAHQEMKKNRAKTTSVPTKPQKPTAKKADKPATTTEPVAEIEDFGEKITGARKDMQSFYQKEMTDDDIISQPLSKIWPKKDIDAIEDTQMAALATALRSTIPSKPRKGYRLGRWVDKVKSTRGIMQNMLSGDMPADEFVSQLTQVDSVSDIGYHAQLLAKLDKDKWSRVSRVDPQIGYQRRNEAGEYVPFVGFAVTIDKRTHTFNTEQRDISEIIDKVNNLLAGDVKAPTLKFDVYSKGRGDNKSYFITQASDKDKTPLIEFNDLAAARAFKSNNSDELVELWNQHKERVNVKKSDMRSSTNRERIGPDHRSGQDVTTEQFMNTFGLRGGQFGNWVKQGANSKDRQRMLNDAYDAFMDLAGVLNIPPEAIGLGGKLAMSFGARGKGRAMAHYEPSQVVINLTKTKGAGSLAHEWFHALDNHFTSFRDDPNRLTSKENAYITYKPEPMLIMKDQKGKPSRMRPITEARRKQIYEMNKNRAYLPENFLPDPNHKEGVRPQVEVAFANLVETLNDSPMKARSITIDKGAADGYWSRIIERAARAFEGYVINKLEKQGARSDFLANITPEDAFPRNMDRYPYLLQSEMAPVAEAFDNLFATIDSKASEDGNGKTLFSRAGQLNQAIDRVKAGAVGSTNTTRQQVIGKLNDKFGKETIDKLMADGKLDIKVLSDFMQDGRLTIPSDVDGLYHNGKATLIADNLSDDMIIPTFLHELGGHGGMQTLMDKKAYDALMKDFNALVKAGDPLAVHAKAIADKVARSKQEALDEYLPYLLTLASRQQTKQGKVAGMINRMVMAIRSWLRNTLGVPIAINSQDILSLAERMVNEVEKQGSLDSAANAAPQFSDPNIPDKQMQDVRDKYEGTDEWMKAPNGSNTNLTEQQWLQVRTPAFKEWFGDWENDTKNASKIIDDNGEPMVVYHGTPSNYNDFNEFIVYNEGVFFTANKSISDRYAGMRGDKGTVKEIYLNIKKPKAIRSVGYELDGFLGADAKLKKMSKALEDKNPGYSRASYRYKELLRENLSNKGFDGLVLEDHSWEGVIENDSQYVAFNPNQIKSATDNAGTFDGSNPDIRYSRAAGMNDQLDPRNIARESMTRLYDWASSAPPGKLSWWHKTIGTMYNLAQRNPYFKPVFENTEKFINDVSFYAAKASEFAPRLLPQLDSIRDITKSAIGAKDNDAISKPIFEGTLLWGRDLNGNAVLVDDWRKKVMATSKQDRLQMLKDANRITPAQLQELAKMNNIQANRFINGIIDEEVSAGLVWTDSELRSKFDLSDDQIELYREFRSATDKSLDSLTRSDMLKQLGKDGQDIEAAVMEAGTLREAVYNIEQHINDLIQASPKKEKALKQTLKDIKESQFRTNKLIDDGYAPLSRFGQYTVDVVDKDGNREYFGMFESAYEARKMKAEMDALYGNDDDFTVTQGALSNEEFKLFAGVTPETAELFGEMMGLDATGDKAADEAFQEYLRRTKNNRSAMKRLMHRKGIKGYSEDVGRVLASFIYSNARHTSAALNMGNIDRSISEIPKGEGQLKDAAVKLVEYIKNPQEEGQIIRGWMFAQYLGGSVASAAVNLTQPIAVSFPYLSQFGGAVKAAKELSRSSSDWVKSLKNKNNDHFEADLQKAIERAEADGTLSPQEVHNLLKQASGKNPLRAGDGTKVGDAKAMAGNAISRVSLAWGTLFSAAEQVNRRVTFVAAYRMAKDQGMSNPAEFATKSIKETQFVYNKASRMRWGRGAVGGTLMTFKTYTVSYMELMHRLWTQGEKGSLERKQGRQAVGIMIGTLLLLGGAGGLPFMEDAEDLIDGIGQIMGYNFSSKKVRQEFLDDWVGEFAGDFIDGGISSVSGSPTDVSGRLGLGNLIPGTGVFKERTSNTRDALELLGPAGDFVGRVASGSRSIAKGVANLDDNELKKGAMEFTPVAVRNAIKGVDMATSGIYKDTKGYKVADVSPVDAAFKGLGFQPRDISKIQEANYLGQSSTSYYNLRASNIRALWAAGVVEGNQAKVADARAAVKDWNAKNPDQKIIIRPTDIARRVREMRMDKVDRVIKRAPRTARSGVAQELNSVRDNM